MTVPAIENWEWLWEHYGRPSLFVIQTPGRENQVAFTDTNGHDHAIPASAVNILSASQVLNLPVVERPVEDIGFSWEFQTTTSVFDVDIESNGVLLTAQVVAANEVEASQYVLTWVKTLKVGRVVFMHEDETRPEGLFSLVVRTASERPATES